jgi:hypothetical protein
MLLVARAGRRRPRRSWRWGCVRGVHQNLPVIALANKNISPIALEVFRTPVLALNSGTPVSGRPYLIASRS